MSDEAIARDLERALLKEMQDLMNRRLGIAAAVLDTRALVMMASNLSGSVVMGTQALLVANCDPGREDTILDAYESAIFARIRFNRDKIVRTGEAIRRGERPEQAL